ncbi:hypothetical protein [Rhodococcus marinonascens]|uniref:hypothetical protein n=1 Tax=Rhodococcus marinonascens TaxID=38311 RepID=UPI000A0352DE|nr:hypothetical protein [Rhodococcus marinonascens]
MIELTDAIHDARSWVSEQLRFPQRAPRTTAVFDWTGISAATQSAVADLAGPLLDPNEITAQPHWWDTVTGRSRRYRQLTTEQRDELRRAHSPLHWPLRDEGPEIRLVAIAENVVTHLLANPSWSHPMLHGHRPVLGFTIELHRIAAAAHELLTLRTNTPPQPIRDGTHQLTRARAEWERRQVVAARAEAGLVDRVAALRAHHRALAAIEASLHNLWAVTELAAGGGDVDQLYQQITGSEYAAEHTATRCGEVGDIHADLDAQIAYLDSLIRPHHNT